MIIAAATVLCATLSLQAQRADAITGVSDTTDVIDHRRFDSLWRASKRFGKLSTQGVATEVYKEYRQAMERADPNAFLPKARLAFWVNAYLACLMEVMHRRVGYRTTVWDSLYLRRDTFVVAHGRWTLDDIQQEILNVGKTVQLRSVFATGSSEDPPFPAHAWYARTAPAELRAQMRSLFRSERFVLYDPAGNALQLARMFEPWLDGMKREAGGVAEFAITWVSESVAAQMALGRTSMTILLSDRMITWKRRRP